MADCVGGPACGGLDIGPRHVWKAAERRPAQGQPAAGLVLPGFPGVDLAGGKPLTLLVAPDPGRGHLALMRTGQKRRGARAVHPETRSPYRRRRFGVCMMAQHDVRAAGHHRAPVGGHCPPGSPGRACLPGTGRLRRAGSVRRLNAQGGYSRSRKVAALTGSASGPASAIAALGTIAIEGSRRVRGRLAGLVARGAGSSFAASGSVTGRRDRVHRVAPGKPPRRSACWPSWKEL
jgi:hypothetical protein